MKTRIVTTALATVLTGFGMTLAHASDSPFWQDPHATLLLAEGGSERLIDYQQRIQETLVSRDRVDEGQRFADLIEEQPTAAGAQEDSMESESEPLY